MEKQNYICSRCNENFNIKREYDLHLLTEPCDIKLFIDKTKYTSFNQVPYFSELYSFKQRASGKNIKKIKTENENNEKVFPCVLCDMVFSRIDSLNRHVKNHCKIKKELKATQINNFFLVVD
jgi:uncharacterized C2H2 Zn-finger protein